MTETSTNSTRPEVTTLQTRRRRTLPALGGGMTVEWYDFVIYGLMATFLGPHFFPASNPVSSTLSALIVFAIGFGARPVSAILFTPLADSRGHKAVLLWSIGGMSIGTLAIGLLPTYGSIGIFSGVLLVICRLIQGLSAGVETPVASAAAIELAEPGKTGRFSGFVTGSFSQFGVLLGSLVAFLCSLILGTSVMGDWGWRVPFIIGGIFSIVILILRHTLPETGGANSAENEGKAPSAGEVWKTLFANKFGLLAIIFVVGATQLANYVWTVGLPNLAQSAYGENATAVFAVTTGLSILLVIAGPIVGSIADRYKASRVYVITRVLLVLAFFLPLVYVAKGIGVFTALMLGGGIIVALNQSFFNYINSTLMPARSRATGIAIGYGLGVAIFGGTAPYLLILFQQLGGLWIFCVYSAVVGILSVVFYVAVVRRGGLYVGE